MPLPVLPCPPLTSLLRTKIRSLGSRTDRHPDPSSSNHHTPMSIFLENVHVEAFRGIPHTLDLPIRTQSPRPASVLIFGDNGTGKSSLADAIEFALQARIHRSQHLDRDSGPSPFSFTSPLSTPTVSVRLSDNTIITRTIDRDGDKIQFDHRPHPHFAVSPLVLRRADILGFWSTPELRRQIFFRDHLRDWTTEPWEELADVQEERLTAERLELKGSRRSVASELARIANVPPEDVPFGGAELDAFVRRHAHGGMSSAQRSKLRRKGVPVRVNKDIERLAAKSRSLTRSIKHLASKLRRVDSPDPTKYLVLQELLTNLSERLTEAFHRTSTRATLIRSIDLVPGRLSPTSLSLDVTLPNGLRCTPQQIFSEANLDLLSFLIVLTIAEESAKRGQAKVFVLDDVFQSIDASIRLAVIDYLFTEFKDWQLLFTVHDRLWKEQLKDLCRRHAHDVVDVELRNWGQEHGPQIRGAIAPLVDRLRRAIDHGSAREICVLAGPMLEEICDELSHRLPVSIRRRRNDLYTIGDLWPAVRKRLKCSPLGDVVEEVDRSLHLRNMVGAHFNAWAESLSVEEAGAFGRAVVMLYDGTHCGDCQKWVEQLLVGRHWTRSWGCRCGATRLKAKADE